MTLNAANPLCSVECEISCHAYGGKHIFCWYLRLEIQGNIIFTWLIDWVILSLSMIQGAMLLYATMYLDIAV